MNYRETLLLLAHQVAKCEVDSDFLAKAASHVDKALRQDYGGERCM